MTPTKPANIKALETGSGISWEEWVELLDTYKTLDHADMARVVEAKIREKNVATSPEWWAQGVTVAYEQHIGRRQPGQRSDGTYSATISKTLPGDMDAALAAWRGRLESVRDFDGVTIADQPRVSSTDKWRYWRCTLADGSKISVNFQTKPDGGKTAVAIGHEKLANPEAVARWKAFWKSFFLMPSAK